jgi:hypothetical protein
MTSLIRRLTSVLAAFALVQATAVPAMGVCKGEHNSPATMIAGNHGDQSVHQADCPESAAPKQKHHGSDCLMACLSMLGCSAPSFVAETSLSIATSGSSPIPSLVAALQSGRSLAPDRPPPRA